MTANDIYLAVRGVFDDRISAGVRRALSTVATTCQKTGRFAGGISSALGAFGQTAGGAFGKVASSIGGVVGAMATLGPIGAVISGVSTAIELFTTSTVRAAKAAEELAKAGLARGLEKLNAIRERVIDGMNRGLAEITTNAERSAKAFDTLANAYLRVSAAKDATAKAGGDTALANLRADESRAKADEAFARFRAPKAFRADDLHGDDEAVRRRRRHRTGREGVGMKLRGDPLGRAPRRGPGRRIAGRHPAKGGADRRPRSHCFSHGHTSMQSFCIYPLDGIHTCFPWLSPPRGKFPMPVGRNSDAHQKNF